MTPLPRTHYIGDGCLPPHETPGEAVSPDPALDRLRERPDKINPQHYRDHPSGVECITIAEHFGFCLGNAIKYIWRAGRKPGTEALEDLKKARWYLDREISRIEAVRDGS